jgi:hypothetical protein
VQEIGHLLNYVAEARDPALVCSSSEILGKTIPIFQVLITLSLKRENSIALRTQDDSHFLGKNLGLEIFTQDKKRSFPERIVGVLGAPG